MRKFLLAAAFAALAAPAFATELGVKEERLWGYCTKQEYAVEIANLYFDAGYEIASSAWDRAEELGHCDSENRMATPLDVVWNRANMADTISVITLRLEPLRVVYWFRLESNR